MNMKNPSKTSPIKNVGMVNEIIMGVVQSARIVTPGFVHFIRCLFLIAVVAYTAWLISRFIFK